VKFLANPLVMRTLLLLFAAGSAFIIGIFVIRRMRRDFVEESAPAEGAGSSERFPLQMLQAVIQQLKQQKYELQNRHDAERRKAKASEQLSAAVLSHVSSGVVFFSPNGLVRQTNAAAKEILGFASPVGMSASQLFREAELMPSSGGEQTSVAEVVQASLRERTPFRCLQTQYRTPAGEQRALTIIVTAVHGEGGEMLGAACLLNDRTTMSQLLQQQELRGEISAEMALELKNSLTTISDCARRLAGDRDAEAARLAEDIATEAAHLEHTVGGFLASG